MALRRGEEEEARGEEAEGKRSLPLVLQTTGSKLLKTKFILYVLYFVQYASVYSRKSNFISAHILDEPNNVAEVFTDNMSEAPIHVLLFLTRMGPQPSTKSGIRMLPLFGAD